MKKIRNIMAIFTFAICLMFVGMSENYAASLAELEANSTKLTYGTAVTGEIPSENAEEEVDMYKFTVSYTGCFQLSLSLTENSDVSNIGAGWNVKIYSANDLVNCIREYSDVKGNLTTAKMALAKGDYYVFVADQDGSWNPTNGCEYAIKADYTIDSHWEKESNNNSVTATAVNVNEQYKGVLTVLEDEDWYKFTTTKAGKFSITVSVGAETDITCINDGWELTVYDSNFTELKTYSYITSKFTTTELPFEKGTFYLKVDMQDTWDPSTDCVYGLKVNYSAPARWESEYNDKNSQADVIKVNEVWNGSSYKKDDEDWYKFTTDKDGKISVTFSIDSKTDIEKINDGWSYTIYDSKFTELKTYSYITNNFTSVELPFAKGTYYVKVAVQDSWDPCLDCVYGIKVNFKTPVRWESEYNDKSTQADVIKVNEVWNGSSYKSDDVDWYKFQTTKSGYFKVTFSIPSYVDNEAIKDGWYMTIYDKNYNEIKKVTYIKSNTTTVILPYGKSTFYVEVGVQDSWDPCLDCDYQIKVTNTASTSYESENNDVKSKSDTITLGKTYNGITNNDNDVDWYKFKVTKTGVVRLELKKHSSSSKEDIQNGWYYIVYNSSNKEVARINDIKSKGVATMDLKKGTYYVKVGVCDTWQPPTECRYTISTKFAPAPSSTKITSISSKAKKVTIKWKKSSSATGYYVYRSESKSRGYKKIATVKGAKKVSYTDKKSLKKGKTYYYKIVAYKTTSKINATAKAGNVKSVKVK